MIDFSPIHTTPILMSNLTLYWTFNHAKPQTAAGLLGVSNGRLVKWTTSPRYTMISLCSPCTAMQCSCISPSGCENTCKSYKMISSCTLPHFSVSLPNFLEFCQLKCTCCHVLVTHALGYLISVCYCKTFPMGAAFLMSSDGRRWRQITSRRAMREF